MSAFLQISSIRALAPTVLAASTAVFSHLASAQFTVVHPDSSVQEQQQMIELAAQHELAKRWAELFINILGEFTRDHRDPTARIEADFSTRLIRIRTQREDREEWVSRTLTQTELATADLARAAKDLYARSMSVPPTDGRGPQPR